MKEPTLLLRVCVSVTLLIAAIPIMFLTVAVALELLIPRVYQEYRTTIGEAGLILTPIGAFSALVMCTITLHKEWMASALIAVLLIVLNGFGFYSSVCSFL